MRLLYLLLEIQMDSLEYISSDDCDLYVASTSNGFMYIENPFKNKRKKQASSLFSTHPSVSERVMALENLK